MQWSATVPYNIFFCGSHKSGEFNSEKNRVTAEFPIKNDCTVLFFSDSINDLHLLLLGCSVVQF